MPKQYRAWKKKKFVINTFLYKFQFVALSINISQKNSPQNQEGIQPSPYLLFSSFQRLFNFLSLSTQLILLLIKSILFFCKILSFVPPDSSHLPGTPALSFCIRLSVYIFYC